ncbi:MAG: discoidin domain-containing protein [Armatimonadota bacterium]|nr:discoidin domain-containing protein [Armatimonadota bacterium]
MKANVLRLLALSVSLAVVLPVWGQPAKEPVKVRRATASSTFEKYGPDKAVDGEVSDASRWVSQTSSEPAWLELDLGTMQKLSGIHLFSGYRSANVVQSFKVQFWKDGQWQEIPSAVVENNDAPALAVPFDDTVTVETDKLRLWITATHQGRARVQEVVVWPAGGVPPLPKTTMTAALGGAGDAKILQIYLNQSGFNLGKPKRFTAPTLADGTRFEVRPAQGGAALFSGTMAKNIGDFSAFNPTDEQEYVVVAGDRSSVPFRIGHWWLERVSYQNAVNFMIDSRHYTGNVRVACPGSFGWRDDHHFGWELHTLVPQYLSNPSAYERMPHQVKYEAPANPQLWGKLQPPSDNAPDIVKLIHWGADVIVTQEVTHEHLKAQLAYFLAAWPALQGYLPPQNYEAVRDFALAHWSDEKADRKYPYDESDNHDLLALKTKIGSTKGAYPPGFSIEPNLLMHEVARRDKRPDANKYLQAAVRQAAWMVQNLDWDDPQTTKGQRMSEFLTMTGLARLQREYPDRAPAGLAAKINDWAQVVIRRSHNLWDFRKLDDGARWTPMGEKPSMWNEVGNVVGLPAALLAARPLLDAATQQRFDELVVSHFDNCFGRNPTGRHFSYDAPREIEGVEFGWYSFFAGGIGRLADARFVLDGAPKDGHYPYHPEKGNYGWTEGWIQFNTPYNLSLAYLAMEDTKLSLRRDGDELVVRLEAPLNFDYSKVESGTVQVTANGQSESVTVTEEAPNARVFSGRAKLKAAPGATVEARYGFGYWGRKAALKL